MPSPAAEEGGDPNTMRILLATDIHLGYAEKHPVKGSDSFNSFREILDIALERRVDFVLLGGDLFHDNKPTRNSERQCIEILREKVLGDLPVAIDFVSDPKVNFAHADDGEGGHAGRKEVNYRDPNMNIAMPVFSIHGNHDDPSGLGGFSCLDSLHSTGLINYFGRINNLEEVDVTPLLITKGTAKLALYGMSSVKDERLHRLFRSKKVNFFRDDSAPNSWFNLLVLHQNRVKHGPTSYIPEHFIDPMFDLAFWGHEHECRLEPEAVELSDDKRYYITQPGSSVATSLIEGEAKEKKVGILHIRREDGDGGGQMFNIEPVPLQSVRPMIFRTVNIEEEGLDLRGSDKKQQQVVEKFLREYVEELLVNEVDALLTGHSLQPELPQVRVRVMYSNEAQMILPGKFGNHFETRVANHSEILLFKRNIVKNGKEEADAKFSTVAAAEAAAANERVGVSMEGLLEGYFAGADEKSGLKLLSVAGIAAAVKNFIEKSDGAAIPSIVERQMSKVRDEIVRRNAEDDERDDGDDAVDGEVEEVRKSREEKKEVQETRDFLAGMQMDRTNDATSANATATSNGNGNARYNSESDGDDDDDMMSVTATKAASTRGARGRGSRGARGARGASSSSGRGSTSAAASRSSRGSSRGRPSKNPVVMSQGSIQNAFAKQAQSPQKRQSSARASAASGRKGKVNYISDSD